ncbi:MAG: hypothetical protein ACYC7E_20285 [Armatimonadota bacterium]
MSGEILRGVYAHPGPFWETGARLDEYGVNAVFIHSGSLNEATVQRARAEGYHAPGVRGNCARVTDKGDDHALGRTCQQL